MKISTELYIIITIARPTGLLMASGEESDQIEDAELFFSRTDAEERLYTLDYPDQYTISQATLTFDAL